ncbi:hypothetical protein IV203_029978 [Nitzschia inconspicua]|uniref:Uncharacterized protein n=1 Tax=Nitzschia inconspicua TaxID=303405 RepID=A0A9K3LSA3_9STRA|nr:hypothetical protein IV203_029978 [Nitzschia inconspicua]
MDLENPSTDFPRRKGTKEPRPEMAAPKKNGLFQRFATLPGAIIAFVTVLVVVAVVIGAVMGTQNKRNKETITSSVDITNCFTYPPGFNPVDFGLPPCIDIDNIDLPPDFDLDDFIFPPTFDPKDDTSSPTFPDDPAIKPTPSPGVIPAPQPTPESTGNHFTCSDAQFLQVTNGETLLVSGTTNGATEPALCGQRGANVVWYSMIGTGNKFRITTCSPNTDFPTQVTVTKDCSSSGGDCLPSLIDPTCTVNTNGASHEWITESGQRYEISVGGKSAGQQGNFELQITEIVLPDNAYCEAPELVSIPLGGNVTVSGSTVNAVESAKCGEQGAKVVWYSFIGTGNKFRISTCSPNTDFPTQVTVTSDCSANSFWSSSCEHRINDDGCSVNTNGASHEWITESGQRYDISVGGRSAGQEGNFELQITEIPIPQNLYCSSPELVTISPGGNITVSGNTAHAVESARCGEQGANVVWYSFIGTGNKFRISTCSPKTDFPTQVTRTSKCYSYSTHCEQSLTDDTCSLNTNGASLEWVTVPDEKYEVSVGGKSAGQEGNFELQIAEFILPDNAYCASPEFVTIPNGVGSITVSGSNVNAVESPRCGLESDAVWYAVIGNGKVFTVSTCSPNTDFLTQVTVTQKCYSYSTYCNSALTDNDCSVNANGASYSWLTTVGEKYEISVSGREAGVQGNFELTITES